MQCGFTFWTVVLRGSCGFTLMFIGLFFLFPRRRFFYQTNSPDLYALLYCFRRKNLSSWSFRGFVIRCTRKVFNAAEKTTEQMTAKPAWTRLHQIRVLFFPILFDNVKIRLIILRSESSAVSYGRRLNSYLYISVGSYIRIF